MNAFGDIGPWPARGTNSDASEFVVAAFFAAQVSPLQIRSARTCAALSSGRSHPHNAIRGARLTEDGEFRQLP